MSSTRRQMMSKAALLAALAPALAAAGCATPAGAKPTKAAKSAPLPANAFGATLDEAGAIARKAHDDLMALPNFNMHGAEKIAMLCYPGMTMLDLVGPQYFLASMMGAEVHLVSKDPSLAPIEGDTGFAIVPTLAMKDCPKDLDILFVPGGLNGTINAMLDDETIDFLADRGSRAKHITSVCTGSLLLGQAGLLNGKRATSHWAVRHLLQEFGAIEVDERVVTDGNILTGAGVSAGLDFALVLLNQMRGETYAKLIQRQAEYAPQPIFNAGDGTDLGANVAGPAHRMFARAIYRMKDASKKRRT